MAITWIFREDWSDYPLAAPLATPRTALPGPGTWDITDSGGKLTTAAPLNAGETAILKCSGRQGADDPRLYFQGSQTRATGLAVLGKLYVSQWRVGWHEVNTAAPQRHAITTVGGNALSIQVNNSQAVPPEVVLTAGIGYDVIVALTGQGARYLIRGGTQYPTWTQVWVDRSYTGTPLFAGAGVNNNSATSQMGGVRATLLASPFDADYPAALTDFHGAGSQAAGTSWTSSAGDLFFEWTQTTRPTVGVTRIWFRRVDASNGWYLEVSTTGALTLFEMVSGTPTQRATVAGAVTSGGVNGRVCICARGSTIQAFVGNVSKWTYASATTNPTATGGLLEVLGTSGVVSEIVVEKRNVDSAVDSNSLFPTFKIQAVSSVQKFLAPNLAGQNVTLQGTGTAWLTDLPTFSQSGVAGVSITARNIVSDTQAILTFSTGGSTGTITVLDPSTGLTDTLLVENRFFPQSQSNWWFSPNWIVDPTYGAVTPYPGAYSILTITGTTVVVMHYDTSVLIANSAATADYPYVTWTVDDGPQTVTQLTNVATAITLATGLNAGASHRIKFWMRRSTSSGGVDRWLAGVPAAAPPALSLIIPFIGVDVGCTITAPVLRAKRLLSFGDSITEVILAGSAQPEPEHGYVGDLALFLQAEYEECGCGGQGWYILGSGNFPKFHDYNTFPLSLADRSWDRLWTGVNRDLTAYDYCTVMFGNNDDGGAVTDAQVISSITDWIPKFRAGGFAGWLFIVIPPARFKASAITSAVAQYLSANPLDSKTVLIDMGTEIGTGLGRTGAAEVSSNDGQHPNVWWHGRIATCLGAAIYQVLSRSGFRSGLRIGGLL